MRGVSPPLLLEPFYIWTDMVRERRRITTVLLKIRGTEDSGKERNLKQRSVGVV